MKKLFILPAIAFGALVYTAADAQIRVGVNLGYQPVVYNQPAIPATPAYGDGDDEYYYLPDLGVYYDVTDQCYFYFDGTEWVSSPYLPGQYANYDWRSARRFEVRAFRPYLHDDFYRERYNGNRFEGWERPYNRGNAYADRDDRFRDGNRNFDRGRNEQHFDAGRGGYRMPNQEYRDNGRQFENHGQQFYSRPAPQNRDNNRGFDNRGQGFNGHQNGQDRNANRGGYDRKDRNGKFGR